jgi:hypothetical protein
MYTLQRTSGSAANKIVLSMHVFVCFIHRVGQNHTFIGIYGVYTVLSAGTSPYIRSYPVQIYGSGQPYSYSTLQSTDGSLGSAIHTSPTKVCCLCTTFFVCFINHTAEHKQRWQRCMHHTCKHCAIIARSICLPSSAPSLQSTSDNGSASRSSPTCTMYFCTICLPSNAPSPCRVQATKAALHAVAQRALRFFSLIVCLLTHPPCRVQATKAALHAAAQQVCAECFKWARRTLA